jgi:hypothetical protein
LIETHQALASSLTSFVLGLVLGLVTVLGFAVDRESWGLAAIALIFEGVMLAVMHSYRRAVPPLMDVAAALESRRCGGSSATDAHRLIIAGVWGHGRLVWTVFVIAVIHVVLTILVATTFNWSFAGT